MSRPLGFLIVTAIAFTGVILYWVSTIWGPGTGPDSVEQMLSAQRLDSFQAIFELTSHWPPLYTLMLSFGELVTGDVLSGARLIHAALYGLNVFLFYLLVSGNGNGSAVVSAIATLCFTFTSTNYYIHFAVYSEALCLSFLLLFLIFFRKFIHGGQAFSLYLAATFISIALLTRYSSLAFSGFASLVILLAGRGEIMVRIRQSIAFGLIAVAPLVTFMTFKTLSGFPAQPRELGFHPIGITRIIDTGEILLAWFGANSFGILIASTLASVAVVLITRGFLLAASDNNARFSAYLALQALAYVFFLYTSITFFDYYTPVDARILSPVLTLFLAALAIAAQASSSITLRFQALTGSLIFVLFIAGIAPLKALVAYNIENGDGYFSKKLRSQDLLPEIVQLEDRKIFSNAPEMINIYFELDAKPLPNLYSPHNLKASRDYGLQMRALENSVLAGESTIVFFQEFAWRNHLPSMTILRAQMNLPVMYDGNSGVIFGVIK